MQLQNGDIMFMTSMDNPFSRFLSRVMKGDWAHASYVLDKDFTIETDMKTIHIDLVSAHLDDPNKKLIVLRPKNKTPEELEFMRSKVLKIWGEPYSYSLMFFLGIRCLLNRKIANNWRKGFVCQSVVCYAYGWDLWATDTVELANRLLASGEYDVILEK